MGGLRQPVGLVGQARPSSYTNHLLDWIVLARKDVLSDRSKILYWLLKSFIIEDKGQGERIVQIVQEDLADILDCSVDSVQRALKPLYEVGLVQDKERRKVSVREPGRKKPTVTTLLIMQINEAEPPAGYTGWVRPFAARKSVRARRAAAKATSSSTDPSTVTSAHESPGQTDTALLQAQSDQEAVDKPPTPPGAVDNLGAINGGATTDVSPGQTDTALLRSQSDQGTAQCGPVPPSRVARDVSAGHCDTAPVPENAADLRQNEAPVRPIGSNHLQNNLRGNNGVRLRRPEATASGHPGTKADQPAVITDQPGFVGNHLHARAETEQAVVATNVLAELAEPGRLDTRPNSAVVNELGRLISIAHPDIGHAAAVIRAYRAVLDATSGPDYDRLVAAYTQARASLTADQARDEHDRLAVVNLLHAAAHGTSRHYSQQRTATGSPGA